MVKKGVSLEEINRKLDLVLSREKRMEREEEKVEEEESQELVELQRLRHIEKEIEKETGPHPLTRVTMRDVAKGSIGAFVGVVAHFTFFYGIEVAEWLTMLRATLLYPLSFLVAGVFMYATGFRKINDPKILKVLPLRLIVMYVVSFLVSALVLFFFSPSFFVHFESTYKQLATVTLIAVIGACTADLIGKD